MAHITVKEFLKKKNVNITVKTYLIDALGAMASACSLPCLSEPSSEPWERKPRFPFSTQ